MFLQLASASLRIWRKVRVIQNCLIQRVPVPASTILILLFLALSKAESCIHTLVIEPFVRSKTIVLSCPEEPYPAELWYRITSTVCGLEGVVVLAGGATLRVAAVVSPPCPNTITWSKLIREAEEAKSQATTFFVAS